uniref:ABC transporter, putative n=1 Tax=Theileria parva TaxID=5875 RepID=Q4N962_THEPA|eukprot:XP_765779.1 ABC transporter [Theileria parva strain Muguga]
MGNRVSVPNEEVMKSSDNIPLSTSVIRFARELEPDEKYHLILGSLGLMANAITNMLYPRIIGLLIDSSDLSKAPSLEKCPEYFFPFPLFAINNLFSKFDALGSDFLFNRILVCSIPLYILGSMASWFRVYHTQTAIYLIQKRYRRKSFTKLLSQNLFFFHSHTCNYLLSKLLSDCEEGPKALVESQMQFLRCCNSAIGGTCHLFSISAKLALVILLSLPLMGVTIRQLSSMVKRYQTLRKTRLENVMAKAEEVITGIENVISFANEEYESDSFMKSLNECDEVAIRANSSEGIMMGSILATFNLSTLIMIYFGSKQMRSGSLTVGWFFNFSMIYTDVVRGTNSMRSVYEITDLKEPEEKLLELEEVRGDLEVCSLFFQFPETKPANKLQDIGELRDNDDARQGELNLQTEIINGVSFKIKSGDVIGIVGPSGAGKTTLCKLIMGIYKPTSGEILLDSNDISNLSSKWLRSSVFSILHQEPILFSTSIEENMKYGNKKATKEQVIEASKQCNLHEYIESLPSKYDTPVGPKGCTLSTGQKQRIALVRTILKESKILILDEPTSSLDGYSEELVTQAIEMARNEKTLIIVTHNQEIVKKVDKVLVLNRGMEYFGNVEEAKVNSPTFNLIFPNIVT